MPELMPALKKPARTALIGLGFLLLLIALTLRSQYFAGEAYIEPTGEDEAVVLYTTDWCPYCRQARAFFKRSNIAFTEYDVEKSAAGYQEYLRISGKGVPVIKIGDRVIQGYNLPAIQRALAANGLSANSTP